MFRWSKIPEIIRPEIISDISDDKFYTLVVQDYTMTKFKRSDAGNKCLGHGIYLPELAWTSIRPFFIADAWEGYYFEKSDLFRKVIDNNIPCILMHKINNKISSEVDTIVCFMTGDMRDVFLVHPRDLTKWDPDD